VNAWQVALIKKPNLTSGVILICYGKHFPLIQPVPAKEINAK